LQAKQSHPEFNRRGRLDCAAPPAKAPVRNESEQAAVRANGGYSGNPGPTRKLAFAHQKATDLFAAFSLTRTVLLQRSFRLAVTEELADAKG
jgi:hypothetical protein